MSPTNEVQSSSSNFLSPSSSPTKNENIDNPLFDSTESKKTIIELLGNFGFVAITQIEDLSDGSVFLKILCLINSQFFIPFQSQLVEGNYFPQKLANLKLCWKILTEYLQKFHSNFSLNGNKPDFAEAAQGNTRQLLKFASILFLVLFNENQLLLEEKVDKLREEEQIVFTEMLSTISSAFTNLFLVEGEISLVNQGNDASIHVGIEGYSPSQLTSPILSFGEHEIGENSMKLDDLKEKNFHLQHELKSFKLEKNSLLLQIKEQKDQIEILNETFNSSNNISVELIETLKREIERIGEKKEEFERSLLLKEKENSFLLKKISDLEENLLCSSDTGANHPTYTSHVKEQNNEDLLERIVNLEDERKFLLEKYQENANLKRQLKIMEEKNELIEGKFKSIGSDFCEKQQEKETINFLKEELNTITNLNEDLSKKNKQLTDEVRKGQEMFDAIQMKNNELESLIRSMEESLLLEKTKKIESLHYDNAEQRNSLSDDNADGYSLMNELSKVGYSFDDHNYQILSDQKALLQRENQALHQQISDLIENHAKQLNYVEQQRDTINPARNDQSVAIATEENLNKTCNESNNVDVTVEFNFIIESLQNAIMEKESEIERLTNNYKTLKEGVKREQKLIMSAWYDMGIQTQKKFNTIISRHHNDSNNNLCNVFSSPSGESTSWLQTQRNKVDFLLLNSRFSQK